MITMIEDVEVFAPEPLGRTSILILRDRIAKIGSVSRELWDQAGVEMQTIPGGSLLAIPGLIDPHEHLVGGSGESGFASQTPEIYLQEIVGAGITTVVGCLGVDTTTRTMAALLARVKGLRREGISCWCWSGGYKIPPATLTGSVGSDVLFIQEVIGAGEIAVSDLRSSQPGISELARLVSETRNAGLLAEKAGVTHFHVGPLDERMRLLKALILDFALEPASLYPTHVQRTRELMLEAIELSRAGCWVDVDTFDEDLARWFQFYGSNGGDPHRLTVSTDAAINSPGSLLQQLREAVRAGIALEQVLPCATSNTATVLKLDRKGRIAAGMDADLILLRREDLELAWVIAAGRTLMADGKLVISETATEHSKRRVHLDGKASV